MLDKVGNLVKMISQNKARRNALYDPGQEQAWCLWVWKVSWRKSGVGKFFFIILLNVSHAWPRAILSIFLALEMDMVCET